MPEPTNEEVARRYFEADIHNDLGTLESLRDPDWQLRWPTTGELVPSSTAWSPVAEPPAWRADLTQPLAESRA